ncbi:hypothetical protein [Streptomyces sp. CAU 1734]|uniref:hypothetical protein n=1 Tax=Streptomyces sp. CAU 1734 TaxID=3140360 RepID=UPI003260B1C1
MTGLSRPERRPPLRSGSQDRPQRHTFGPLRPRSAVPDTWTEERRSVHQSRFRQRQTAPGWVSEGTRIRDPLNGRTGIVQFIGEFEDPTSRVVMQNAVFVRPEGGRVEWVAEAPSTLEHG